MVEKERETAKKKGPIKLYVEGGGDASSLKTECRRGFSEFLKKAGFVGKMPRIVACGSRENAFDNFSTAVKNGETALLLVDSESEIHPAHQTENQETWTPWAHLKERQGDNWAQPVNATDEDCHLMVQCMEAWFLSDHTLLSQFFGSTILRKHLPNEGSCIETISKKQVFEKLSAAIKECGAKSEYSKGSHSFKLLANLNPDRVINSSPWARRFMDLLKKRLGA